jgi:hypothetical protein
MQSEKPTRIPSADGVRALWSTFVSRLRQQFERRLSLRRQQLEEDRERALILPFDPSTPSTRAERLLRLNARLVNEEREEKPTASFLAALRRLETTERRATLSDALSRLGLYIKTKR